MENEGELVETGSFRVDEVSDRVPFESRPAAKAVWLASFRDERFLNEWIPKGDWDWV